jgi:hypothetical protein
MPAPALAADVRPSIGLRIAPDCGTVAARTERSRGTRPVDERDVDEGLYEAQAILPRRPWEAVSGGEAAAHAAADTGAIGSTVHVVKAPRALLDAVERFVSIRAHGYRRLPDEDSATAEHAALAAALRAVFDAEGPLHFVGQQVEPPGRETLTLNEDTRRYIGLHVDSWDPLDVGERHAARNRMSLNLGPVPRWFLYIPMTLPEVAERVAARTGRVFGGRGDPTPMARRFMALEPDAAVIRCRIEPGEAYIAPTENAIHDGSSGDAAGLGRHFTVLGRIRPR